MATRRGRIEQEIAVKVTGAEDVKKVEKAVDDLDGKKAVATVGVDTGTARKDVDQILADIARLDGETARAVLEIAADNALADLRIVTRELAELEGDEATVEVRVARATEARADLARIEAAVRDLDGDRAEVTVDVDSTGLDALTSKLDELPGALGKVGSAIGAGGIGGAAAAIGGAFVLAADAAADMAIDAQTTAQLTGDTVEDASRLQAVWRQTGADVNDLNDVMLQLNGVLADSPELAAQLGINLDDGATIGQRFAQVVRLVESGMIDATTQSKVFGEEGVRQVAKLVTLTNEDLAGALARISDTQIVSDEDVDRAIELKQQFAEMTAEVQGLAISLGQDVTPIVTNIAAALSATQDLRSGLKDIPVIGTIFENLSPTEVAQTRLRQFKDLWGATFGAGGTVQGSVAASLRPAEQLADTVESLTAATEDWAKANKPIDDMPRTWEAAANAAHALLAGQRLTANQQKAIAILMEQYGLTEAEVLNKGAQLWDAHAAAVQRAADQEADSLTRINELRQQQRDTAEETTERIIALAEERKRAIDEETISVGETQLAVDDLAGAFEIMGRREEALSSIFDLGNAGIEAVGQIHDIEDAMRDLDAFITEEGVPDILDPDDVDAGPFLDKIAALRGPIQDEIIRSFTVDGREAAIATGDRYVKRLVEVLGGALTEQQVRDLLNLDSLHADIDLGINHESLLTTQATLDLLTQTPLTMSLGLGLDAKEISPEAVQVIVNDQLRGQGVVVPAALASIETDAARAEAQAWLAAHGFIIPAKLGAVDDRDSQLQKAQNFLAFHPLEQPVKYVYQGIAPYDQGGTVGYPGGLAAERGPEIINDRYLATRPTIVPPGTRVTSRVRTATILRNGRGANLRAYDAGGTVPIPAPVNVTINAGVIGNRYDLSRTVERAVRDGVRLRGTRS